jgi:hypothetical protein
MLEDGQSSNIEDRRGMGGKGLALGGGGIGTLLLVLAVWLCGGDPQALLDQLGGGSGTTAPSVQQQPQTQNKPPQNDAQTRKISSVLKSTENVWNQILPQQARIRYSEPKLVLFENQTSSACGYASSATGPFYCPGDEKLYLDFSFFDELQTRFGAPAISRKPTLSLTKSDITSRIFWEQWTKLMPPEIQSAFCKARIASRLFMRAYGLITCRKKDYSKRVMLKSIKSRIGGRR